MFLKSKKKHFKYFKLIIEWLHCVKLYINLKKCEFFRSELKYFRFIINKDRETNKPNRCDHLNDGRKTGGGIITTDVGWKWQNEAIRQFGKGTRSTNFTST